MGESIEARAAEMPVKAVVNTDKGSLIALGMLLIAAAALYFNSRQTKSSQSQAENSNAQTLVMSHSDQAKLTFSRSYKGESVSHEPLAHFTVRNIGKAPASEIVLSCGNFRNHGPTLPFGSLGIGDQKTIDFPINEDPTNLLRLGERRCWTEIYASYKDDASTGPHYVTFDADGNAQPDVEDR